MLGVFLLLNTLSIVTQGNLARLPVQSRSNDMEIFAIAVFSAIFWAILDLKQTKERTPEEELGAAISKYLSKGVKVRIEKD